MVVDNGAGYVLILGDVRTGKVQARIPFAGLKWGMRLNAAGAISATLRPHSKQLAQYDLRNLTTTVKQFMGVTFGGEVLEAGPIWTRPYDQDTGELTLNGLGLWSIFDKRKNLPGAYLLPGAAVTEAVIQVTGKHLGSVARELVRISIQDNPYGGDLPVVLPADVAGPHQKTYRGYNLGWLGDDLRELTKLDGGPDLRFRPRYVPTDATRIEWVLEHGAVDILEQAGPDHQWDARVERSGVTKLGVSQDGTGLAAMAWATGNGQEQAMKLTASRDSTLVAAGYPWLETEVSAGDEESLAALQSISDRKVKDSARPWDTWSMTVRAGVAPVLGSYLPGDWAVVNAPDNHPVIPPGVRTRVRILAIDGDASGDVKLAVAPIQGAASTVGSVFVPPAGTLFPADTLFPSDTLYPA